MLILCILSVIDVIVLINFILSIKIYLLLEKSVEEIWLSPW